MCMVTPEEARRRDALMYEDRHLDKIITAYIPMLCLCLLLIWGFFCSRYCHAMQVDPPTFYRRRNRHFWFLDWYLVSGMLLFLLPGIRFEEDKLTIDRWKIIPNKIPSLLCFGVLLYLFLTVRIRPLPEMEAWTRYRVMVVSGSLVVCLAGRVLIYVLYRYKMSPYFSKKLERWWPDNLVLVAVTVVPLVACVLIDRYFDRIAFPHRYG